MLSRNYGFTVWFTRCLPKFVRKCYKWEISSRGFYLSQSHKKCFVFHTMVWPLLAAKHPTATCSPSPGGMGKRIRKVKAGKLLGWDKDSLMGKAKWGIYSLLPLDRQLFSYSQAPSHITVTWEDKCHHSEYLPFVLPTPDTLSMTQYSVEYAFGHLKSDVVALSSPSFLCIPSVLPAEAVWGTEKVLALCKHCSAITEVFLCYQQCFQLKSHT